MTNGFHNDHGSNRANDKPKKTKIESKRQTPKPQPAKEQKANTSK